MREIVLDTETTGLDPVEGHRLVEIGCVELFNHVPTGKTWHQYINPERDVPPEAVAVHGLTAAMLKDKPVFSEIFSGFIDFIGDAALVIHNAEFDMKFINFELAAVGHPTISMKRVTDTLQAARRKFPGSPASLDALCRRFNVDNSGRDLHGALLDAQLLAEVYLEMMGGRQHGFGLHVQNRPDSGVVSVQAASQKKKREPRSYAPSAEELEEHAKMARQLSGAIWLYDEFAGKSG